MSGALSALAPGKGVRGAEAPWADWVRRVVIHVSDYLSFEGKPLPGGRQRHVFDLVRVIREDWHRDVVIVQKGVRSFEATDADGIPVVGLRADVTSRGDPGFGFRTRRFLRPDDGMVYAAGEDAWPFFQPGAKGVQHGIWWDGPFSAAKRAMQRKRVVDFVRAMRSVLCVDTNFVNWLRCLGPEGLELCHKCVYVPNYADTARMALDLRDRGPHKPLRILFARRFEYKRGAHLLIDALAILRKRGFPFEARLFTISGIDTLRARLTARGLAESAEVAEESMEGMLSRYADADVAVVPTIWSEGTSLACVEAICAGVPVVATPVGGLANVVIPHFNGMLVAPEAAAIARGIEQVADETTWRRMRANCLALQPALSRERWRADAKEWLAS